MRNNLFLLLLFITQFCFGQAVLIDEPIQGFTSNLQPKISFLAQNCTSAKVIFQINNQEIEQNLTAQKIADYQVFEFVVQENNYSNFKIQLDDKIIDKTYNIHQIDFTKDTLRILTGSCSMYQKFPLKTISTIGGYQIFKRLEQTENDLMVWLGDQIYYNKRDLESTKNQVDKYLRARKNKHLRSFLSSTNHLAIWDDHDYGPNNADGNFALKDTSLTVFNSLWNNPKAPAGVYHKLELDKVCLYLLDSRTFKKKGENGQLFGKEQNDWLFENLIKNKDKTNLIFSGTQILNPSEFGETLGDFPAEKKRWIDFFEENHIPIVHFISGDRHFAEIQELILNSGQTLFDFTTSPISSFYIPRSMNKLSKNAEGRKFDSFYRRHNYARISIIKQEKIIVELFNRRGKQVWKLEF